MGCAEAKTINQADRVAAEMGCDKYRGQLFPDTVTGVYDLMIDKTFAAVGDDHSGDFSLTYTWTNGPNETVHLVCEGNVVDRTITSLEFLDEKKSVGTAETWSY